MIELIYTPECFRDDNHFYGYTIHAFGGTSCAQKTI